MFQSEHLQEKWAPLLDYDGLDKIEDSHKRSVTAVLLENQEKFLRDEQSFQQGGSLLSEQPTNYANAAGTPTGNPATTAGFGANASSPVAGFDKYFFPNVNDDLLSQGYQTPGESGLAKWRFSNVYPVMKLQLNKSNDGPSIDQMVDASKEFVNIEAAKTAQRMQKTYRQFQGFREEYEAEQSFLTIPLNIEIPQSQTDFNLGLMFRESLEEDTGMLFIFAEAGQKSFHMKDTKIPLDIAFIKEDGTIESIKELDPFTLLPVSSDGEVLYALEVNRGWFVENSVNVGDKVLKR